MYIVATNSYHLPNKSNFCYGNYSREGTTYLRTETIRGNNVEYSTFFDFLYSTYSHTYALCMDFVS